MVPLSCPSDPLLVCCLITPNMQTGYAFSTERDRIQIMKNLLLVACVHSGSGFIQSVDCSKNYNLYLRPCWEPFSILGTNSMVAIYNQKYTYIIRDALGVYGNDWKTWKAPSFFPRLAQMPGGGDNGDSYHTNLLNPPTSKNKRHATTK